MGYASPEGRRLQMHRYRLLKRQLGCCLECRKPSEQGGRCTYHLEQHRERSRRWMQVAHGHAPRPAFTFASEWQPTYWERTGWGRRRVSVDWLDPLTILLRREAAGTFVFYQDRAWCA